MTLFNEPTEPKRRRHWVTSVFLVLVVACIGYFLLLSRLQVPSDTPEPPASNESTNPEVTETPERPAIPADTPAPAVDSGSEPAPEPSPELVINIPSPSAPVPLPVILRVTSDVVGAQVFVDRQYVGTTPFESHDITKGRHRINVSAPGYESHVEDIDVSDDLATISVTFKQVVLNQHVAVVHKHRFGDCEGRLLADTNGIQYQTDHNDSFTVPFDALDEFEIDYLEHNLRITVSGQRTYNFTDHEENADALFVFHREVKEAQERLARGDRPASQ